MEKSKLKKHDKQDLNNSEHVVSVKSVFFILSFWYFTLSLLKENVKGCVHYIFAGLFCMSKRQQLRNKDKYFLFHFESFSFLR